MKTCIFWTKFVTLAILVGRITAVRDPQSFEHLSKCIQIAEPLVRDPKYIFPLNVQDIREVCRMWDEFIACVIDYANLYMGLQQQQYFNRTIQTNIEVIQQLCAEDPDYQKVYMAYAPCMKRVSIGASHCGNQYTYLTDLVQGRSVTDGKLCCAHQKFRECVLEKTAGECDGGGMRLGAGNSPSQFMRDMLDQTMGFLLQKCKDFIPNSRDCPNTIYGTMSGNTGNSKGAADDHVKSNIVPRDPPSTAGASSMFPSPKPPPASPSATTPPTTRFTWTTRNPTGKDSVGTSKPTPSLNLAGTGLLGPASQQFKDSGVAAAPKLATVILAAFFLFAL